MRSIGNIIKQARARKKLSIARLSSRTKIKQNYILAIEKEQWGVLPSLAVAQGFVKNIAGVVGVDGEMATALLRRDFQERKETKTHETVVVWTPKATIVTLSLVAAIFLGFYLFRQYSTFAAPPPLTLGEIKRDGNAVTFSGKTNENAQVLVGDEAILVDDNGNFQVTISINSGDRLTIQALSRSGKATKKEMIVP